jgi:hypothetical protein
MKFFDFGPFFRLTVNIALPGAGLPAAIAAVPELAAAMTVYDGQREVAIDSDSANAALLDIARNMPLGLFAGHQSRYNPVWASFWQELVSPCQLSIQVLN